MSVGHNRKLVMSSAADFNERTRFTIGAGVKVRDNFEDLIIKNNFFESAPFTWISFIICYVKEEDRDIVIKKISKKDGDLAVSAYWNYDEILKADRKGEDELAKLFEKITRLALIKVAEKYNLDKSWLE